MTPRGFDAVRKAAAESEAKRAASGPRVLWFKIQKDQEAIIRFLEQDDDVACAYTHEIPVEGRQYGFQVPCVDQEEARECPGCERDMKRQFRGYINVIWFDAPVYKKDSEGKIVKDSVGDFVVEGKADQVAVLSSGIRLFDELAEMNVNYRGLMSRRFKIRRKGTGFDTKYPLSPEDVNSGPQDLSAKEKELAKDKYDLSPFITPPSYEDFLTKLGEGGSTPENGSSGESDGGGANPFMRRSRPGS